MTDRTCRSGEKWAWFQTFVCRHTAGRSLDHECDQSGRPCRSGCARLRLGSSLRCTKGGAGLRSMRPGTGPASSSARRCTPTSRPRHRPASRRPTRMCVSPAGMSGSIFFSVLKNKRNVAICCRTSTRPTTWMRASRTSTSTFPCGILKGRVRVRGRVCGAVCGAVSLTPAHAFVASFSSLAGTGPAVLFYHFSCSIFLSAATVTHLLRAIA
jgi:hypothetical protein